MSDFVVTRGTYDVEDGPVILRSDGSRIDVKYNWEREVDPDASPKFFVKDSTVTSYQVKYDIDKCDGTMLVSERENATFIAIETDLKLGDEFEELRKYKLAGFLDLRYPPRARICNAC